MLAAVRVRPGSTAMSKRPVQRLTAFTPGDLDTAYYNDLGAGGLGASLQAETTRLETLVASGPALNPVTVAQLGLAALDRRGDDAGWERLAADAAATLEAAMEDDGSIPYRFAMPHTYALEPPWISAMAQGQAASLFLRLGRRPELGYRALRPLHEPPLLVEMPEGPVLQEYPTRPPAHVLNGWIFALFGLYDASVYESSEQAELARAAFERGAAAVAARIPEYETLGGWSRYDLYPHRLTHVASPFYHSLHVELLRALVRLAPDERLEAAANRLAAVSRGTKAVGIARKVLFRIVVPRS
jgi:heparosan-N-sulfate-glucuronate 5-epimerase